MIWLLGILGVWVIGTAYAIILGIMSKRSDMIYNRIRKERFKERWHRDE